jgi:uncharacterized lipoprotein YmbA
LAVAFAGCIKIGESAPPPKLFLLQPRSPLEAVDDLPAPARVIVSVGPVDLPDYLDRPQLVTRKNRGQVEFLPGARWAEPLEDGIRRVLAADLQAAFPGARFVPGEPPTPDDSLLRLEFRLDRFEGGPDSMARMEGEWWLLVVGEGEILARGGVRSAQPWAGGAVDLVRALDSLLADFSRDLVPQLRAAAEIRNGNGQPSGD